MFIKFVTCLSITCLPLIINTKGQNETIKVNKSKEQIISKNDSGINFEGLSKEERDKKLNEYLASNPNFRPIPISPNKDDLQNTINRRNAERLKRKKDKAKSYIDDIQRIYGSEAVKIIDYNKNKFIEFGEITLFELKLPLLIKSGKLSPKK